MSRRRLKKAYREKNARRIDLLRKAHGEPLTAAEAAELLALQDWVDAEIDRVYGLDFAALERLEAAAREQPKDFPEKQEHAAL